MLHEVVSAKDIPPDDPRWKTRAALKNFVREQFEDRFFIVEDLQWGYFTFVVRSNPVVEEYVNNIKPEELANKFQRFLSYEKIPPEKIRYEFLKSDDPKVVKEDKIIRFDILE